MMEKKSYLSACILAVAIVVLGILLNDGIHEIATKDCTVSVKGLSTRDVKSDYVIWPLSFSVEGDDLSLMYKQLSELHKTASEFLISKGFEASDLSRGNTSVTDNWAGYYEHRPAHRYQLSSSVIISTDKVDVVVASNGCQSELLDKGIILNSYDWDIDYQYNGLSELKPEMIEEATKNARAVAQKFADDSNSRLGSIRHANQGQFSVEGDRNQPWMKHVRVVTTVDYALK